MTYASIHTKAGERKIILDIYGLYSYNECMPAIHHRTATNDRPEPFRSAEEVWFWCAGPSQPCAIPRPCTPGDVLGVIAGLYRQRRLSIDHLHVIRFYGARQRRPDPMRRQERRAHGLWVDAMRRLHDAFEQRGIVYSHIRRVLIDLSLERAMKDSNHA